MGYSAEDIEERAEKLYTLYRTKRHHDSPAPQTVYYLGCSPEQTEANLFAAALTMPRQAFTHHWHNTTGGDLGKQSELFRTSIIKTRGRAHQLRLIP